MNSSDHCWITAPYLNQGRDRVQLPLHDMHRARMSVHKAIARHPVEHHGAVCCSCCSHAHRAQSACRWRWQQHLSNAHDLSCWVTQCMPQAAGETLTHTPPNPGHTLMAVFVPAQRLQAGAWQVLQHPAQKHSWLLISILRVGEYCWRARCLGGLSELPEATDQTRGASSRNWRQCVQSRAAETPLIPGCLCITNTCTTPRAPECSGVLCTRTCHVVWQKVDTKQQVHEDGCAGQSHWLAAPGCLTAAAPRSAHRLGQAGIVLNAPVLVCECVLEKGTQLSA